MFVNERFLEKVLQVMGRMRFGVKNSMLIALQNEKATRIATAASWLSLIHILDKVTLTDTVSYKDLTPGKEYRVTGVLMDKSNGKELLINGEKVTAEATSVSYTHLAMCL